MKYKQSCFLTLTKHLSMCPIAALSVTGCPHVAQYIVRSSALTPPLSITFKRQRKEGGEGGREGGREGREGRGKRGGRGGRGGRGSEGRREGSKGGREGRREMRKIMN